MSKRAAFHTLGCKVNQYETEAISEQFRKAGFAIVDENEAADAYIINTCTVTNLADRKSRQFIRRFKKRNPDAVVVVTGCYAQVKPEEVSAIEGVEVVCGTDEKGKILDIVQELLAERAGTDAPSAADSHLLESLPLVEVLPHASLTDYEELGHISGMGARSRAFIKIQDGCENYCTYCLIPYARGHIRSRAAEDVVAEVRGLVQAGFSEIVLTGINTAYYGKEKNFAAGGIEPLIAQLNDLPGDFRIRLSSLEPTLIDANYVKRLLPYDRLCHHLHLALQSGSDRVLGEMHRRYTMKEYYEIVDVLRDFDPNYGISTDIIVGFPGETEEDFRGSVEAVRKTQFCKTHVFPFSPREGTPAAVRKDQIAGDVKHERAKILMEEAELAAQDFLQGCIGEVRTVLTEQVLEDPVTGESQGMAEAGADRTAIESGTAEGRIATEAAVGYTDNYIKTYLRADAEAGKICKVRLTGRTKDGMIGELI